MSTLLPSGVRVFLCTQPTDKWHDGFPNAACVVALVDRLTHNAEVIALEGQSYRLKEAQQRAEQRAQRRKRRKS